MVAVHALAVVCVRLFFFFQAEDGIRDYKVTGVQTCALPIYPGSRARALARARNPQRARRRARLGVGAAQSHRAGRERGRRGLDGGGRRVARGCGRGPREACAALRSEEHTSELQSPCNLVCRLLLEKKKKTYHRQ